jgi:glyoxylase-like metal-dependent hydrolase (beta-lactamase superfamily II)
MNRKDFLIRTTLLGASTLLPLERFAHLIQTPFTTLRRNVGTFTGRGGTIGWLATNNSLVAVDSQYPNSAQACIDGLKEKTDHVMDYLINTHHHGDHTAGNPIFKDFAKHIVAHKNVPQLQKAAAEPRGQEALDSQVYADMTYTNKWTQEVGDETIHLMHNGPAHTGGDSVVYFEKANVAHMGDLMFNRVYPFIDINGGANIANWIKVLRTTVDELENDTIYIYGHGNPEFGITGNREDLILKSDFLEALLEYTQKGIDEGKTGEEIASASEVIPGFEVFKAPGWSLTLSRNVNAAYTELTSNK